MFDDQIYLAEKDIQKSMPPSCITLLQHLKGVAVSKKSLSKLCSISSSKMAPIIKLQTENDVKYAVQKAAEILRNGGIIAIPTDTLYGVSTLVKNSEKIYKLKQRPHEKPLGLFVANFEQIEKFSNVTVPLSLLEKLLPGPVTLIFQRSSELQPDFNPTTENVGIRIPQQNFVQLLTQEFPDESIAQTSANLSGTPESPLCIEDFENLWPSLDLIIDAGPIIQNHCNRNGSTIIDLSVKGEFKIVRDGCAKEQTVKTLKEFGLIQQE
jgi:tRNA threonylcarbamoyl adenosine modification protein (Sua5/YciO/YrdC/YwlC family)